MSDWAILTRQPSVVLLQAGYLDSLSSSEFVRLTRMVEDFVMDCERICGRQSHSLRATLLSQAKKFVERFHEERKNKLRWQCYEIFFNSWKQTWLISSLLDSLSAILREVSLVRKPFFFAFFYKEFQAEDRLLEVYLRAQRVASPYFLFFSPYVLVSFSL